MLKPQLKQNNIIRINLFDIKGFSLAELLIVLSIISVLITLAIVSYRSTLRKERFKEAKTTIELLINVVRTHKARTGNYSNNIELLTTEDINTRYDLNISSDIFEFSLKKDNMIAGSPWTIIATVIKDKNFVKTGEQLKYNLETTDNPWKGELLQWSPP